MAGPVVLTHAPPTPLAPTHHHRDERRPRPRHSCSPTKHVQRRLICLWKRMTGTVRNERASILPDGFVLMGAAAAHRRSLCMPSAKKKSS